MSSLLPKQRRLLAWHIKSWTNPTTVVKLAIAYGLQKQVVSSHVVLFCFGILLTLLASHIDSHEFEKSSMHWNKLPPPPGNIPLRNRGPWKRHLESITLPPMEPWHSKTQPWLASPNHRALAACAAAAPHHHLKSLESQQFRLRTSSTTARPRKNSSMLPSLNACLVRNCISQKHITGCGVLKKAVETLHKLQMIQLSPLRSCDLSNIPLVEPIQVSLPAVRKTGGKLVQVWQATVQCRAWEFLFAPCCALDFWEAVAILKVAKSEFSQGSFFLGGNVSPYQYFPRNHVSSCEFVRPAKVDCSFFNSSKSLQGPSLNHMAQCWPCWAQAPQEIDTKCMGASYCDTMSYMKLVQRGAVNIGKFLWITSCIAC